MRQVTSGSRMEEAVVGGRGMARSQAGRSQRGVPAEDDLQFSAVQFPSIGQSHDALLVPHKSCCFHILHADGVR